MTIGGFTETHQVDARGMTPLQHAFDHAGHFLRAAYAAEDLIRMSSIETINKYIVTDAASYPDGYAAIHILASGVDPYGRKPPLMRLLLKRKQISVGELSRNRTTPRRR